MLVKKSNNQVLVKKTARTVFPISGGPPVMMLGGGGGGGSRGRTLREQAGGIVGGLVGVAGALTGNHRSLGGLTNAMVSGGATGSQLGSAFGRKFVGRRGQEIANLREAQKRENARLAAAHKEEFGASGFRDKPIADQRRTYLRGVAVRQAEDKQRARQEEMAREAHARAYGGQQGAADKVDAETMRNLRQRFGGGLDPFEASSRVNAMNEGFESRATPEPAEFYPTEGSFPVVVRDPVEQATQTANNNFQTAGLAANNAVIPSPDGVVGETNRDGALENTANYGAEAINDEIDVEEGTPPKPEGEASKLDPKDVTPEQQKILERSLRGRRVKVE